MLNKTLTVLCAGALLSTTMLMPVSSAWAEGTWQKGGLATNQVSGGTAKAQKTITDVLAYWGLLSNSILFATSWIPIHFLPGIVCTWATIIPACRAYLAGGSTQHGLNIDVAGAALDGVLLYDAMHKKAVWSEDIPNLEAQIRQIGSAADLEQECEDDEEGSCNATNATLDKTEVYIKTLKNVGLEAIEDVAGSILKTPTELISAGPYIQEGFGSEVEGIDVSKSVGKKTSSGTILWSDYLPDENDNTTNNGTRTTTAVKKERTETELNDIKDRKLAHLQLTGTAGVARADMGATVARSEKAAFDRLSSYVGSGDGLIANIKVLTGLDLTLSQRLNTLNMLQGQQVANDAASALQFVETK